MNRFRLVMIIIGLLGLNLPCFGQQEHLPSLWNNAGDEACDIATSPVHGTLAGYGVALGMAGMTAWALQHDIDWFYAIQDRRNDWQDKYIPPFNLLGDGLVHVVGYAALYKFGSAYDQQVAAMALEGQINVALFSIILKTISSSARPDIGHYNRQWFTFKFSNNSFPSGHTMTAFCAAVILGDAYHCEWLTYPLAGLVGYARLYSRRHWPADVLAGAGMGLLIGYSVLAYHQHQTLDQAPGVRFSLVPNQDGGKVVVTWRY